MINQAMRNLVSGFFRVVCLSVFTVCLIACAEFNDPYDPYYRPDPYYRDPYYPDEHSRRHEREHREIKRDQRELERERERLEEERRRLEEERNRRPTYNPPAAAPEHCPSGFSPSEQKCSPEERRRGCKDIRLPGGLGCVKR
jgi:hypothetical protein